MTLRTLNDVFFELVTANRAQVMLTREPGPWAASETSPHPAWTAISASQIYSYVMATARRLHDLGIQKGDRVVILSENRPEWAIADFASILLGAADVPIYPTLTADQIKYMFQHSEAKAAFVSNREQYHKVVSILPETNIQRIVVMDDLAGEIDPTCAESMAGILRDASPIGDADIESTARAVSPEDLVTVMYTSGTTGTPKGVMLTHGNIASNINVSLEMYPVSDNDLCVSFLPLSHIIARHLDYAMYYRGVTVAYCPVLDNLMRTLSEVRPTLFVGVPRLYEKVHNGVHSKPTGVKRKIYNWAMGVGQKNRKTVLAGQTPKSASWKLANHLVFSKVRAAMGGRVRFFLSGGAPLGYDLATWFADIGIRIHEGYGLTETSPVVALNNPVHHRLGTVGKMLSNVQVEIAEDGEILVHGPLIFKGYWKMPQETAEAIEDGWFKTGDIGALDTDGYLSITDRKKDLMKTSGGKFIAPQPIESSLKGNPFVGEACLLGDRRRFPAVLIVPNFEALETWAREHGVKFGTRYQLIKSPAVQELYEGVIETMNTKLARYEQLKKVLLIPEELSIADGTLTPSMKLRRRILEQRYHKEIESLYRDDAPPERAHSPAGKRS